MRWLPAFLSLSLFAAGSLGASRSSEDRFSEYHAKSLSTSPVKLDDVSYKDLTAAPRDYAVVVLLTALDPRLSCQLCREFQPEWDILAHSWTKGDKAGNSRVLFGTLDFNEGRNIYMELGLQTAPVLFFFPPTTGPHAPPSAEPIRYDFVGGTQSADQIHQWVVRHTPHGPHPPVKRPINWVGWGVTILFLAFSVTLLYVIWPYALPVIQNRNVWAAASLIMILLFISGQMYNHIRRVPYVAANNRGGISYFAGGFQNQFGMETQIVAAMYGILSFISISLAIKAPRMPNPKAQQVAIIAWSAALFVMYSFLLSVFRIKNGGYPFSLPPFM